ncbi:MAG: BACON domain-containing protein [Prevotella sp.]|nr:BACON domain-containing protein [Prevotella sp.]MBQ8487988.1 BACON domain-containing protein [Prevotella sp.]
MKSIKALPLCLLCCGVAAALTACTADEATYTPAAHLTLRSSAVSFTAQPQQGLITTVPTVGLTAQSDAPWCTAVATSDSTVSVSVGRNERPDGRTAIVSLSSASGTARVSVTQQGAVWYVKGDSVYLLSDAPATLTIPVRSDYDYDVSLPQWISGQPDDDGYLLTLQANTTGQCRHGRLVFSSSQGQRAISIYQIGEADLAGTYEVDYAYPTGTNEQRDTTVTVQLVQSTADSLLFYAENLSIIPGMRFPMTYDPLTFSMTITAGQLLGQTGQSSRYVFTALGSNYGAHVSTAITYPATLTVDPLTLQPVFSFNDTEGFDYYDTEGNEQHGYIQALLTIGTVENNVTMTPANFLGYADRIYHPRFRRIK